MIWVTGAWNSSGMDFSTLLSKSASQFSGRIAVWCDGREQTYAELYDRASRLANALTDRGLNKGDRVALLSANAFETTEQIAALALGGFVRAGLYAHETGEVNAYLTELVDARVLIVHESLYANIAPQIPGLEKLEHVLVFGGEVPEGADSYEGALANASATPPTTVTRPDDIHVIRFSAGTTGRPKGIVHTMQRWLDNNDEYRWVTPQIDERDAYLAAGQLTHAAVLWLWPILQVGGRIVVMPAFEPGRALELIEQQRVTVTLVVPTMISALLAHPDVDTRDLSSLRCLNYAASPIAERTMERALLKFGPVLYQLYAQSECITATMLQPHQHTQKYLRSVGRATPNAEITIVDPSGNTLPVGEIGEIAVRAPGQMSELWKNPEANEERHLPDGRLLTRDMGYLDEDGFLFLADRKEDMIISGGYNIWPAELENAVASHEAVREVCVVGIPHEKWGETPRAFVVVEPGSEVTEMELIEVTRAAVGSVKKVTSVEFVDALPKSGVGKILRREVKKTFWEGEGRGIGGA
ncbi:acyl-CoA synthetase (AMP-forming)/AMP-acid ligase II [Prescottella agglutinans]|uniref:Acyl-CoA synthetase (AMP-forming)/AMP-acid ligase II n=2 Tax=Prescottella agglutinans TaxID=1644129 RepID=A0ABT6MFH9_9NOCA|nr:acyl-CoA synthetase (AMP-forming)/AMP-acid ligase II [Prescottella agglutinans]